MGQARENHKRVLRIDADYLVICYMIFVYPIIPMGKSWIMILWMLLPLITIFFLNLRSNRHLYFNKKILPLFIIPICALFSGGLTAIAYAIKISVVIFTISLLQNDILRNYQFFIRIVRVNGLIILATMYFEYLFRNIAIPIYAVVWRLYLQGDELTLLQCVENAYNGFCYGIIPSASYAANTLTFAFGTYLTKKEKSRIDWVLLVLIYIGIILTSKRSYMVFVTLVVVILSFVGQNRKELKKRGFIVFCFISICIGLWVIIEPYIEYVPTGIGRLLTTIKYINDPVYLEKYYILSERDVLSSYAIELFRENWVFGIGWGNFSKIYLENFGVWRLDAHSTYLQILCESGLFFAIIIFSILFRELAYSLRLVSKNRCVYYYMGYIILFCVLIGLTAFIFSLVQIYTILFFCVYFARNITT